MAPNLLVSYDPKAGYMTGRNEVQRILAKFGDQKAQMELLVPGIIGVSTSLKNRDVIEEVKEMFAGDPLSIESTLKWVPCDFWCEGTIEGIKSAVKEEIKDLITSDDQYAIDVAKHRSELHTKEVIEAVAPLIRGKVNLDYPQKIIRIELFDKKATITLLTSKDIFSVARPE
jgi:tRNA(Ser,Leu) C12 N-acetylase TAN1